MMKKIWGVFVIMGIITGSICGATINVSDTESIQTAIDGASSGDVINVAPGTYTENIQINVPNLTLQSTGGRDNTFIGNPNIGSETIGISVLANMGTVTVDGFTVDGFRNGICQSMSQSVETIFIVKNCKVIPENNDTTPYLRNGIQVTGNDSQVIDNYVVGAPLTSTWSSTGIGVVNASRVLVKGNTVNTSSADIGINVLNYSAVLVSDITIEGNTVIGATNCIRISGGSEPYNAVRGVTIKDNTLTNSPDNSGINVQTVNLENLTVTGNVITGHSEIGVRFSPTSATLTGSIQIYQNNISGNGNYGIYNGTTHLVNATNNWWGDSTGPNHSTNTGGLGNSVSDNVVFNPWSGNASHDYSLSVDLVSFTATQNKNTVVLAWETGAEVNNQGFIVEKKSITSDWTEIANYIKDEALRGAGNSSEPTNYTFTDVDVVGGMTYEYRIIDVDFAGLTKTHKTVSITLEEASKEILKKFVLNPAYPNPFNPTTTINYGINEPASVNISILDMSGRLIETLVNEQKEIGYHTVKWNASNVASGIYIYKINVDGKFSDAKRCVLMK